MDRYKNQRETLISALGWSFIFYVNVIVSQYLHLQIVGDISDEYDSEEEASVKVVEEGRVVEVSARERVEDVNECLGIDLPEDGDYDTIAGFVFAELGRIPKVGETFHCHGAEFRILSGDDRRLGRLRVIALESQDSAAGES